MFLRILSSSRAFLIMTLRDSFWRWFVIAFWVQAIFACGFIIYNLSPAAEMSGRSLVAEKNCCLDQLLDGPLAEDHPITLEALKGKYLDPPSTKNYKLANPNNVKNSKPEGFFLSHLFKLFDDQPPGFFIEAGALNGEGGSNTIWLEYVKKWTGLLIEANPENYEALLSKNRKAWTSNTCLARGKYPMKTIFEIPKRNYSIPTRYRDSIYRANGRVIDSFFHTYKDEIMRTSTFSYSVVQCFPLASYLFALNVTNVDFLSLDTQGGEKDMILNFPHDKINVRAIVTEHFNTIDEHPLELDKHFVRKMNELGFKMTQMEHWDYFFIKASDPLAHRVLKKP